VPCSIGLRPRAAGRPGIDPYWWCPIRASAADTLITFQVADATSEILPCTDRRFHVVPYSPVNGLLVAADYQYRL
jgi:hypothetical protein